MITKQSDKSNHSTKSSSATSNSTSKGSSNKSLDPKKCTWEQNYHNQNLSGIEFRRSKGNDLVKFIAIKHADKSEPYRIIIQVNEADETFTLPPKQTFEEMIQAKRRQQMLLYGPGTSSTSSSAVLSDRAARRVAAAARRQSNLGAAASRQHGTETAESARRSRLRVRPSKKKGKKKPSKPAANNSSTTAPEATTSKAIIVNNNNDSTFKVPKTNAQPTKAKSSLAQKAEVKPPSEPIPSTSGKVLTSMKELVKHNPLLSSIDTKEVKMLLKSAPPGASIVLPNGTVIRKSRRGGARAGAGRKRSRPLTTNGQQSQTNTSTTTPNASSSNTSASLSTT